MQIDQENVQAAIRKFEWDKLYISGDKPATIIPERLLGLVDSKDEAEAIKWYDLLEDYIVVQGGVNESAYASIYVLIVAINTCELSLVARGWIYELIFQCLYGYASQETVSRGNSSVADECLSLVRDNINIFRRQHNAHTIVSDLFDCICERVEKGVNE